MRAWDAEGRELDARFVFAADRLSIEVDDRDAAYPLTVDPWPWTLEAKLLPADPGTYDHFGAAVSVSGDLALVSSPEDSDSGTRSGSAYVFARSGTEWSQAAKLRAEDGAPNDEFGHAAFLSGVTALLGAHQDDDGGNLSGSVYIFAHRAVAAATFRNAGANPASYVAVTPPALGTIHTATFHIAIPPDLALLGYGAHTQAIHTGGGSPFALSNAQDLFLGR